jgi:Golgi apparatus protein 1
MLSHIPPLKASSLLQVAPLETLDDLVQGVASSRQRTYLLVVLFSVVGAIFVVGLVCGRSTRRYRLLKNR